MYDVLGSRNNHRSAKRITTSMRNVAAQSCKYKYRNAQPAPVRIRQTTTKGAPRRQKNHPRCAYSGPEAPLGTCPGQGRRPEEARVSQDPPQGVRSARRGTTKGPLSTPRSPQGTPGTPAGNTCCCPGSMCFPPKPRAQKGIQWGRCRQPHVSPRELRIARRRPVQRKGTPEPPRKPKTFKEAPRSEAKQRHCQGGRRVDSRANLAGCALTK